VGFRAFTLYKY